MRKQYCLRRSANGWYAWDVDRLVSLASGREPRKVRLDEIAEIDENHWFGGEDDVPTCRRIALHARLIEEADLGFPILLCSKGRVMDGMHRVLKALNAGLETVDAIVFEDDPEPDFVDVDPNDLPY